MKEIDKSSPIPIYHQLYEILKSGIEEGVFEAGSYLPSENTLARSYGVSRLTVRQALSELLQEGLIEKHRGRGTIVKEPKNVENLTELRGFTDEARISGQSSSSIVLENKLTDAPSVVMEKLDLPAGSKMILLKRLRLLDGIPYAVESAYVNPAVDTRLLGILDKDMSKSSLYDFFRNELNLVLKYADETLEVDTADAQTASLLNISSGECVVLRKRFTYTASDECVEYVFSVYRGDKYKFNIRISSK